MDLAALWPYIEAVSKSRLDHNKTSRHVSTYGEYIETIGAAGELAARRFLQLPEVLHERFDGGADMTWRDFRIDIKATVWTRKLRFRYLQWPEGKPIRSDLVILTAVNMETKKAAVVGWALPHEILNAPVNRKRDFPCHEIAVRRLHSPGRLLELQSTPQTRQIYQPVCN